MLEQSMDVVNNNIVIYILVGLFITLVGALLYAVFFQRKVEHYGYEHTIKYMAILITKIPIDYKNPLDFHEGFDNTKQSKDYFTSKDNVKIQIKYYEDFLIETESNLILKKLINDKNCLLIICNTNSTLTNSNIDLLVKEKNRTPVIMPIATEVSLINKAILSNHKGILRMLPDNDMQAGQVRNLISKNYPNAKKIVLYGDEDNPSYSINLLRDISEKIRANINGGMILIEELIGHSNSIFSGIELLKQADVIVYAGVSHTAFLLIDQLSCLGLKVPFIMTDGCVVESIFKQASKYQGDTYLLFPTFFNIKEHYKKPYYYIGEDTYKLCEKIFSKSGSSKNSIYQYIEQYKNSDDLNFTGAAGKYQFNSDGNNIGRKYIVYSIKNSDIDTEIKF